MNVLFLTHRTPYPPDRGDRIRAFNIRRALSKEHQLCLGCFEDRDQGAVDRSYLDNVCDCQIVRPRSKVRGLLQGAFNLLIGKPATLGFFWDSSLAAALERLVEQKQFDAVFVFSSAMAQYAERLPIPAKVADIADVDSDKWKQYAARKPFPLNLIYAREARTLAAYERKIVEIFDKVFVVSEVERQVLENIGVTKPAEVLTNGVDCSYYEAGGVSEKTRDLVFVGVMNYYPNLDGVRYFMRDVLPKIRRVRGATSFAVVGSSPPGALRRHAKRSGVEITGWVPDVRSYLQSARVCVIPLRIARGVQNKVLEAMAAGVPVLCTPKALEGIDAEDGKDVVVGRSAEELAKLALELLDNEPLRERIATSAKLKVKQKYDWNICLDFLNGFLQNLVQTKSAH